MQVYQRAPSRQIPETFFYVTAVKLQKRWKGIRDAYIRDRNKKIKSGSGASTSKDYLYSHLLSFLNPMVRSRSKTPPQSDDDSTTNLEDSSIKITKKKKKSNNDVEDKLIQVLIQRMDDRNQNKERSGGNEPDYNFALSLVDDLKAIHPDYKMDAKMEIMGILKKYKQMSKYLQTSLGDYSIPEPTLSSPSVYDDNSNTGDSIYTDLFTEI